MAIAMKVDAEVTKAYEKITPMKRQQIENLVNNLLKDIIENRSTDEIIKDMQQQAKKNGLTEEILQEILEDS